MSTDILARTLGEKLGDVVLEVTPVSGGDINEAYRVALEIHGVVFVKTHRRPPSGMYSAEASGLRWLVEGIEASSAETSLRVPSVAFVDDELIALEWIDLAGTPDPAALGRGLALLHDSGADMFGLPHDNFLATLPQDNTQEADWPTFYVERRLRPLCARATLGLDHQLDALRARPDVFGPAEPPSRLHGDLWWGNVSACAGQPVLFDPAVYGGHREVDLAMLALFGGLPDRLVDAYEDAHPLHAGWRARVGLHQLYPLAAHACLFGGGYGGQVRSTLARYL